MKKITVSILTTLLMLSMVFSSSVFAANEEVSAWDSFLGLFSGNATTTATDAVGVEYRGHIQNVGNFPLDGTWIQGPNQLGTVGQSLRLEGFWIRLSNQPENVNIQYRVHVQNEGWMTPVENGAFAGTEGKSQQIEAIEINLVDDEGNAVQGYSVQYKGHIQNQGDTAWFEDGQQLGTVGSFLRLEALEVKIVQTKADMAAYEAAVAEATALTEADYTAASWAALETALIDNLVTEDNTQAEVDAATAAINDAIDALVKVTTIDLTATGVKELTVTFNQAVDTDAAKFAVVKGTSTTIGVSNITWNDEKTVAKLTLSSKLGDGTYTVNVTGVEAGTLTDSVTTVAEVVTSIEIPSDLAVLQADASVKVAYKILNQYGEDITDKTTSGVTYDATKGGTVTEDPDTGIVAIAADTSGSVDYFAEGQTVNLTIVHTATGTVATKKLTVSASVGIASVTYGEVYNEDGYPLSEDYNSGADKFYLPVVAKDQFGNTLGITELKSTSMAVLTTSDDDVIAVDQTTFVELDINDDGVKETVLPLTVGEAGTATVKIISLFDGMKYPVALTVAEPTQVDTITLSQPDLAVVGEKVVIPFEAIDNNGDAVTSLAELNDATNGVTCSVTLSGGLTNGSPAASATFKKNASTGVVELILDLTNVVDSANDGGTATILATTATDNTATLKVTVEEKAVATAITGLYDTANLNPTVNGTLVIGWEDVTFIDQFERVMDNDDLDTQSSEPGYRVDIDVDDNTVATVDAGASTYLVSTDTGTTGVDLKGLKKGTTDITFTLEAWDASLSTPAYVAVDGSDYTTTVRVATTSEFASYEASTVKTVFDDQNNTANKYQQGITVYGVLSNGTKVVLPANAYTVRTDKAALTPTAGTNEWKLDVTANTLTYVGDATETTAKATVTINATGEELSQTVTISKVAPKVATLAFTSDIVSGGYDWDKNYMNVSDVAAVLDATESEDSYGETIKSIGADLTATFESTTLAPEAGFVTITDVVDADDDDSFTIANNGTKTTAVTGIEAGDSYKVTVGYVGGATKSFSVVSTLTDITAPTVTTKLAATGTQIGATTALVFSEDLDTASQTAVKTAVDNVLVETGTTATVTTSWTDAKTLTLTFAGTADASNYVTLGTVPVTDITDLAGNTTADAVLQN